MSQNRPVEAKLQVERLRGIDPHLLDERGNHALVLVNAPCDVVAEALSHHSSMSPEVANALAGARFKSDPEQAIFVYQLRGHGWTQIDGRDHYLLGLAEDLSRQLGTQAFTYMFQDMTGGYGYSIYNHGELVEEFSDIDLSGFGADAVEGNRRQAIEKGCRVSSSGRICFFTKRGTKLDLDSPQECEALLEIVAKELGIYVAADVLHVGDSGQVQSWRLPMSDLQAAKVLRAFSEEEQFQLRRARENVDEDAKLDIKEASEEFQRLQRILASEMGHSSQ